MYDSMLWRNEMTLYRFNVFLNAWISTGGGIEKRGEDSVF